MEVLKSKIFKWEFDYGIGEPFTKDIYLSTSHYANNNTLAVIVMEVDGNGWEEEVDVITVNLPFGIADDTHAYIDTNNCSWAEKMLKKSGLAKPTGEYGHSGWCSYPLYEFNLDKFE